MGLDFFSQWLLQPLAPSATGFFSHWLVQPISFLQRLLVLQS
jgi:hypothetical protein